MYSLFHTSSAKTLALYGCLFLAALQVSGCSSREERAQNYYEHAKSYFEKQDFVKARIELRNAVQLNGNMIEAWRTLSQIDEHDKNWQGLAGDLRKIVELDPKDISANTSLARIYLFGGALDQALKSANAAGELDPNNAHVLALKAAILLRLKDTDGATKAAEKALEIDSDSTDAAVVLAFAKYTQGDSDGALRVLANIKGTHKDDLGVLYLQINIYDHIGNDQQAEALLRKLVALYPKEPAFRSQLVRFYVTHKRPDDAVNALRVTIAANPDDTKSELDLVNLLISIKGPAAGRTELVARINAGGHVFPYQLALAKLDFAQGNLSDSTKLLETIIGSSTTASEDGLVARATLAEMYLNKNNVASAEPLIADILRLDSRNTEGLRLRAAMRISRGQLDDAVVDLRAALNDQPRSPELLANLGLAYERKGSIELADKAYFDATKASGFAPTIGLNYVAFLRRRGLTERADTVLSDLANRNANNVAVLSALAQVKLARQDWVGAHEIADTIHRLGDKGSLADQINGAAFSGQRKFSDSLAVLQNAYDANPTAVQPMAALVAVYLQARQTDKAEAFINAVLKANPANAEAHVLMGSIQLSKNNPDQAAKDFNSAIQQQPKDVVGYRALAGLYVRQKKTDQAIAIVQAGLQQQPQSFALQLTLAGLLEAKGEYEPAIEKYESMLKDQPASMIVANNLASLLTDHRSDKASLERASELSVLLKNSQVPQFKDTIGWVSYQRGDYAAASSFLEDAVSKLPNVPLIHYHLGMVYLATAQDAKASEQFKKAQDLAPNDAELKAKIDAALRNRSEKVKG